MFDVEAGKWMLRWRGPVAGEKRGLTEFGVGCKSERDRRRGGGAKKPGWWGRCGGGEMRTRASRLTWWKDTTCWIPWLTDTTKRLCWNKQFILQKWSSKNTWNSFQSRRGSNCVLCFPVDKTEASFCWEALRSNFPWRLDNQTLLTFRTSNRRALYWLLLLRRLITTHMQTQLPLCGIHQL